MPPRLKRKFKSDQELSGRMAPQFSSREAVQYRLHPVPTPETQDLYNKFREEEERQPTLTSESLQQIQPGTTGFLQPPSPSQPSVSSPSPSHHSATHSISRDMGGMGLDEQTRARPNRRPGRNGPLSELKKRKTALMRKLGACDECRERRVGVRQP